MLYLHIVKSTPCNKSCKGFWFGFVNAPVNNFSVMSGRSHRFLGITSTFWEVNVSCSRTQHGDLSEDRTPTFRSRVRRSTTRPWRLPNHAKDCVSCPLFSRSRHILRYYVFSSCSVNCNIKMTFSLFNTCH